MTGHVPLEWPPGCLASHQGASGTSLSRVGTVSLLAVLPGSVNWFILPAEIILHLLRSHRGYKC